MNGIAAGDYAAELREADPGLHPAGLGQPATLRGQAAAATDMAAVAGCRPALPGTYSRLMRVMFRCAMLWEWAPMGENPMNVFRLEGSSKRMREPRVVTSVQLHAVLDALPGEPFRTTVVGTACLGLRCSELSV
jgi:hypothetical protein